MNEKMRTVGRGAAGVGLLLVALLAAVVLSLAWAVASLFGLETFRGGRGAAPAGWAGEDVDPGFVEEGVCPDCGRPVTVEELATYGPRGLVHVSCPEVAV